MDDATRWGILPGEIDADHVVLVTYISVDSFSQSIMKPGEHRE
jgi:hypothetical protein